MSRLVELNLQAPALGSQTLSASSTGSVHAARPGPLDYSPPVRQPVDYSPPVRQPVAYTPPSLPATSAPSLSIPALGSGPVRSPERPEVASAERAPSIVPVVDLAALDVEPGLGHRGSGARSRGSAKSAPRSWMAAEPPQGSWPASDETPKRNSRDHNIWPQPEEQQSDSDSDATVPVGSPRPGVWNATSDSGLRAASRASVRPSVMTIEVDLTADMPGAPAKDQAATAATAAREKLRRSVHELRLASSAAEDVSGIDDVRSAAGGARSAEPMPRRPQPVQQPISPAQAVQQPAPAASGSSGAFVSGLKGFSLGLGHTFANGSVAGGTGRGCDGLLDALATHGQPGEWWHDSIILGRLSAIAQRYFSAKSCRNPWKAWVQLVATTRSKKALRLRHRQMLAFRRWRWRSLANGRYRCKMPLIRAIERLPQATLRPAWARLRQAVFMRRDLERRLRLLYLMERKMLDMLAGTHYHQSLLRLGLAGLWLATQISPHPHRERQQRVDANLSAQLQAASDGPHSGSHVRQVVRRCWRRWSFATRLWLSSAEYRVRETEAWLAGECTTPRSIATSAVVQPVLQANDFEEAPAIMSEPVMLAMEPSPSALLDASGSPLQASPRGGRAGAAVPHGLRLPFPEVPFPSELLSPLSTNSIEHSRPPRPSRAARLVTREDDIAEPPQRTRLHYQQPSASPQHGGLGPSQRRGSAGDSASAPGPSWSQPSSDEDSAAAEAAAKARVMTTRAATRFEREAAPSDVDDYWKQRCRIAPTPAVRPVVLPTRH
eukprot:gnl/TRDRNA2_/TRDRNA2_63990_c0_seq1.p1 gnl/TRDRNA2_/TRDRNA2_63990_c0~~gnl/TRDRNA2_/TRDRNA2_63990_c0_seq1.p1  ORF type:complete len:793 (+),score=92.32 gnl/TRDRNA2_/TRDRNA2_63990_c0_seq1:51-2381(+)